MTTTLTGSTITQLGQGYELRVLLPAETLIELGLDQNAPVVLEIVDGQMIIRRATITEQTAGIGAPWRTSVPFTPEQENEAFERAVAEDNASYE